MRALCASIITSGALIGLGLAGIGLGARYQYAGGPNADHLSHVRWNQLDTGMMLVLVVLLAMTLIGLAMTYVGLAYHHERRHHERHGLHAGTAKSGSLSSAIGD